MGSVPLVQQPPGHYRQGTVAPCAKQNRHQGMRLPLSLGASMAAFGAGAIRTELGDYRLAFQVVGVLCLIAGASFIVIGPSRVTDRCDANQPAAGHRA